MSDYYFYRYGVDTRSVRFPGLISYETLPGGGTTDYAVEIYYAAVKGEKFEIPVKAGTFMDMMYMPDALKAMVMLMEADPSRLKHRNSFNIASMSFDPESSTTKSRNSIPISWPNTKSIPCASRLPTRGPTCSTNSCARAEWDWKPDYDLESMSVDMIEHLKKKLLK